MQMVMKALVFVVALLLSPRCAAFAPSHKTGTCSRQSSYIYSYDSWQIRTGAVSDSNNHNEMRPDPSSRNRKTGSSGDPYISPLLDSMSRRLRRLQLLHEQNDLFGDDNALCDTGRTRTVNHDQGATGSRSSTRPPLLQSSQAKPKDVVVRAGRIDDDEQLKSIHANAPAVLLQSGPGTGKSCVLAARIAYLIKSGQCQPENLVILSFTNRDAAAIKQRALDLIMNPTNHTQQKQQGENDDIISSESPTASRRKEMNELGAKLWSGTLHAFSSAILKKYGGSVRVVAAKDMRGMVKICINRLLGADDSRRGALTIDNDNRIQLIRHRFKEAINDSNQNLDSVVANVVRCIELWKESALLPPPITYRIPVGATSTQDNKRQEREREVVRQDCVELAVRWGVPQSVATLALDIYPDFQKAHAAAGTADPSDLATLARDFLLANPAALSALRSKLMHVVLDEYQDVSVSQHALLRLVVRGHIEEHKRAACTPRRKKTSKQPICFNVPRLFCAGDANQSLYGWRGAMPTLTVDRFLSDYPQGVTVPLNTNYRLPRSINEAANLLVAAKDNDYELEMTTFAISPASRTEAAFNMLHTVKEAGLQNKTTSSSFKKGKLVLDEILSKSSNTIRIQELWDVREEAKFVAATIRKNSKERISRCAKALAQLVDGRVSASDTEDWSLFDPTAVAIVVRSSVQFKVIQEMLQKHNIPFSEPGSSSSSEHSQIDDSAPYTSREKGKKSTMHMKPVKLITMHQCKGDEFDDVYLCGWSEGVFPHPASVSSGTVKEERRLAYVALTRARQRAVITYPTIDRIAHVGRFGERKYVTSQVRPSRFLFELMAKNQTRQGQSRRQQQNNVRWNEDYGFKYTIAGKDLPLHFSKSYQVPDGFRPENELGMSKQRHIGVVNAELEGDKASPTGTTTTVVVEDTMNNTVSTDLVLKEDAQLPTANEYSNQLDNDTVAGGEHLLGLIQHALLEMADLRIKGTCKLYTKTFKDMLKDFGISRGVALVFNDKKRADSTAIDELINASDDEVTTKAISRCTAKELGHFLLYLILSVDKVVE